MTSKAIPEGYRGATPYLMVGDAASAIEFYKKAEFPEWGNRSPESLGGSPVIIHLYVPDVDALAARAIAAGAKLLIPVADQFYGDRSGRLADPFGHVWIIATHKEDVSPEEIQKRYAALYGRE